MRRLLGCLLLYGRRTPPPSITMMNGRVQVWIRDDQDEAFRIFDKIRAALASADEATLVQLRERQHALADVPLFPADEEKR